MTQHKARNIVTASLLKSGQGEDMKNHPPLNARPDTPAQALIKYAAGITLATVAFVVLGWVAGF